MTEKQAQAKSERVLIVEDDEGLCQLLAEEVRDAGFQAKAAGSAEEARSLIDTWRPDLVVSDLRLPGAGGMELLSFVRTRHAPPGFIAVTAFGTISQAVQALKAGADDFLTKPLNLDHFMLSVSRTLEMRRLREKVQRYQDLMGTDHFHGIVGRSQGMRILFDHITQVARASGPVLIVGESGVGKELVARAIHEESPRADGPFLAVNCAGVPHDLLESEFFGYARGAFTGARQSRKGLFAEAEGGTLLLDEIAEMPAALQAKLLRVLQEGTVRPVGSSREQRVDVRICASTNRNLEEAIEDGRFRADLFYRLETFQLHVPPLRERGEDLDLLAAHFLNRYRTEAGKEIQGISPAALQKLSAYPFPGNVRELQNVIERAVTFCDASHLGVEHLPARVRDHEGSAASERSAREALHALLPPGEDGPLPTLAQIERQYIRYVLGRVSGNKRRAAGILDIGRRTLYRRLDQEEDRD